MPALYAARQLEPVIIVRNGMNRSSLIKEQAHNDILFTVLIAMIWADSILLKYVRVALQLIPYIWKHADMFISMAYIICIGLSVGAILRSVYIKELFYVAVFYAIFYLHFYSFTLNETYFYSYGGTTITRVFPMFLVGICAYRINREYTMRVLYVISVITVFSFVIYTTLFANTDDRVMLDGDMHGAYNILPHICLTFAGMIRKPNPWNITAFGIGAVLLLFLGNRGSLLCLGVFVIAAILFSGRVKRPLLFLTLSVLGMLILFAFGLLDFLYNVAEDNDFSLRIFKKLESGEIASSSGRDKIQKKVWEYILLYPMMGMGIFADRRICGGYYAHNVVLEILLHYGVVIGTVFIGLLLYIFARTYSHLKREKDLTCDFFLVLMFSYVFKLFISNSYLMEPFFFFAVGFSCAAANERMRFLRLERSRKERKGLVRLRRIRS